MNLLLVRHGESEWNQKNLFTGWTDVELSAKGVEEAKSCGRALKKMGLEFDICYTSYLKRAIHTLQYILAELDRDWLPVVKTWQLNERHYGALQGMNKEQTSKQYGDKQLALWRRSYSVAPPMLDKTDPRSPYLEKAYEKIDKNFLPLGESLEATSVRVMDCYTKLISRSLESSHVLLVAHGNTLRALIKYLDGISDEAISGVDIATGQAILYHFTAGLQVESKEYIEL